MEKDKLAIDKLLNDYAKALINGDAAALASLYCDDAEFMPMVFQQFAARSKFTVVPNVFFKTKP